MKYFRSVSIANEVGELVHHRQEEISADDVISAMRPAVAVQENTVSTKKPGKKSGTVRAARKLSYDKDGLIKQLERGNVDVEALAGEHGVSKQTIYNVAMRSGISIKRKKRAGAEVEDEGTGTGIQKEWTPETSPTLSNEVKTKKIKNLLKRGFDNDYVAGEAQTSSSVVAFIRRQMMASKEL